MTAVKPRTWRAYAGFSALSRSMRILAAVVLVTFVSNCGVIALGELAIRALPSGADPGPPPRPLLKSGNFSLLVLPTGNKLGEQPYFVCMSPQWGGPQNASVPPAISFDLRQVSLKIQREPAIRPTAYAIHSSCPFRHMDVRPDLLDIGREPLLSLKASPDGRYAQVWLRFDVVVSVPNEQISIYVGDVILNEVRHSLQETRFDHPWYQ